MEPPKISILFIEDDKVDQMAFERYVKKADLPYDYTIAGSVAKAKNILESNRFDIIIADYMLGDGVSFELFDYFRDQPVIVTTGIGNEKIAVEAMKLGAYDYLIKDPEGSYLATLQITVENACKRRETEKKLEIYQYSLESLVKERTKELELEIAERKQAEEALQKTKMFNETILNISPEVIYVYDIIEQKNIYTNKSIGSVLGYSVDEIQRMASNMVKKLMHPDDFQTYLDETLKLYPLALDNETIEHTYRMKHKNGKYRWLFSREVIFLRGKKDEPKQIFGILSDITRQKEAEIEKINLEAELRQSQKMESIGTLTGGIAHDFNNILGIILGNTELALDSVPAGNPAYFNLEEIKTASLRAADIVRQLLSFSRKTDQKLKSVKIVPIILDALNFLRSTIPTTIEIKKEILAGDETVLADPVQLNQIMMNLCINASHAMELTGGSLTITVETLIMDMSLESIYHGVAHGKYIRLIISDTGSGIGSDIIDRIFDPYFTTKEVGQGSGMGLAVVMGIVKSYGGYIFVDSELGKGTRFTVLFSQVASESQIQTKRSDIIPKGSETILLVDDEKAIADMLQQILERLGYKVESCTNPLNALEIFTASPGRFDLVLTDMTMPQMTGITLSESLKAIRSDIPVIICTGHSSKIDEKNFQSMGIEAYILKPIMKSEIAKIIRRVLDS